MGIKTWPEFKEAWRKVVRKWPERDLWTNIKKLSNLVDDYPDWLKEKIHGAHLPFGYEINISFMMMNRKPTTWDIIRKQGDYPNIGGLNGFLRIIYRLLRSYCQTGHYNSGRLASPEEGQAGR
jgi:hypothetical protein